MKVLMLLMIPFIISCAEDTRELKCIDGKVHVDVRGVWVEHAFMNPCKKSKRI